MATEALLQRLAAVRGRLSLCADQAAAAKWWLSMPMASVSAEGPMPKALHKAHLAPDAGLQAPGASLSFAQGSHDFESLDRGIGRGDRFETAHRLDQYLELSVIGLDHVIEILHLPVGRLPVQLSFALQFGDRCTIARRFVGIERGRLFPVLQASQGLAGNRFAALALRVGDR
ncbi:hypothetical protein KPZU09_79050 [Klebsiella pneumoniae]|uniref:Uncharacterized protein n=1 Tax=Klebsiella pneumoniae TaxID=573 RepID=A0A919LXN9_KLEPN|nr:hypothetical protein KPZU09_79050 [Klebsiella pneumoniae]